MDKEVAVSEREVYTRLIDWLNQAWWKLPEAEELLPLIMAWYTPEEAELLTGMPFSGRNLEELAEMKRMAPADLSQKLDAIATKGLVFRSVKGDTVRYSLNDSFFASRAAGWPGRTDEVTKTVASLMNRYYYQGFFDQYDLTHLKGLRVLPINEVIEAPHTILPYDDAAKLLDSAEFFAVSTCPCRHRKNLDPDFPDCEYPTEVCIHMDRLGRYTVENDMGREISRREAHDILRRCAEVGLVHGVSNQQEGVDTICNCCKCCCIWFEAFHKLKHSMSMSPSSYRVRTNQEKCIGCGLCVRRCPMEALRLEDHPEAENRVTAVAAKRGSGEVELTNKSGKVAALDPDLCIGCGVCAYKCRTESLALELREVVEDPPLNLREYAMRLVNDFAAATQAG